MNTRMIITAIMFATLSLGAFAQETTRKFGLELRPGASLATQKLGDAELKPGLGFEFLLEYNVMKNAAIYAGWGWNKFASDGQSFAGVDVDFEETGYVFGLRYTWLLNDNDLGLFAKAGGIYNHIEMENENGDIMGDSGHGWGWQAEAGVDIPLGSGWKLRPGLKYQSLNRDLEFGSINQNVNLNYISLGIGISKFF
jgi:hypothetical protein